MDDAKRSVNALCFPPPTSSTGILFFVQAKLPGFPSLQPTCSRRLISGRRVKGCTIPTGAASTPHTSIKSACSSTGWKAVWAANAIVLLRQCFHGTIL